MNLHVIRAIFRRNFISYFSNPTGYVFICVFVLLSSIAAFWPNEFFNSNLANLDQLNTYLPYILLVFIPAITMSIWADERRQGTDELLLTIPAGDFDVVLGKYLAAVAIFTVALLFSLVSNFCVLYWVGDPDAGLFLATYFGYWMVGWTMLAIGMVASFLTGNLTVGFVLGALFNVPLAFAASADVIIKDSDLAIAVKRWSIANQFHDFARGVISFSSVAYFAGIAALMLYLCMVLIGRRHWRGGQEGRSVALHYFLRFLALAVVIVSIDVFLARHDSLRADITSEGLSSLAPQTRTLLRDLNPKYPIQVFAYVSNSVPENYVQTKLNLLSTLSELKAAAGDKIDLDIRMLDPLSPDATQAEQQFGIRPQPVEGRSRGARAPEDIFLAVAVTCGLDKVVIPFFDRGLPVEYELVRSIATVSQQKRKKVGVLTTDAKLYGGFEMQSMSTTRNEMIIDELQKQYTVVQVDPSAPIQDQYDVLLAVQPSSLGPQQMEHFIAAVKNGQPTAIFEDPFPFPGIAGEVAGTAAEKQPPGGMQGMMMGRQPPAPKGNIAPLWAALGIDFDGQDVVWQDYNPYPQIRSHMPKEWVFATANDEGTKDSFNEEDPITSGIPELLLPYPGSFVGLNSSPLKFTQLVSVDGNTGVVPAGEILERSFMGPRLNPNLGLLEHPTGQRYIVAARITGKLKPDHLMSDKQPEAEDAAEAKPAAGDEEPAEADAKTEPADDEAGGYADKAAPAAEGKEPAEAKSADAAKPAEGETAKADEDAPKHTPGDIDVVLVADIDCLYSAFFQIRSRGSEEEDEIEWRFENVTFVLNILDSLSGDDRFIEIRKHRPVHRTLTKVAEMTEPLLKLAEQDQQKFSRDYEKAKDDAQTAFNEEIAKVQKQTAGDPRQQQVEIALARQAGERRLNASIEELKQKRDKEIKATRLQVAQTIRRVQDHYKLWGVLLPPVFPLLVAFFVFFNRRAREREGVAKSRLRE